MIKLFTGLRHSLSARLLLLFVLAGVLTVMVLVGFFMSSTGHILRDNFRAHLEQYATYVFDDIGIPPNTDRARELAERLPIDIYIQGPEGSWSSNDALPDLSSARVHRHSLPGKMAPLEARQLDHRFYLRYREAPYTIVLELSRPEAGPATLARRTAIILVILSILIGTGLLIRRLFKPLDMIREGVARVGRAEFDQRITIKHNDELGELAKSINAMTDDIERMLEAKRELLLAVSHELRSPLTRARVSLELTEPGPYRERIAQDLAEMAALVADMLESERLNDRHAALHREPTDLTALIEELIAERFADNAIDTRIDDDLPILLLDPARMRVLIANLLDNALRYTPPGAAKPEISAAIKEEALIIQVQDHGKGVSPEHLPKLTEPFYRADPSRQKKTGGAGLGLYLCKRITEAHGGELLLVSPSDTGLTATVRLPLSEVGQLKRSDAQKIY